MNRNKILLVLLVGASSAGAMGGCRSTTVTKVQDNGGSGGTAGEAGASSGSGGSSGSSGGSNAGSGGEATGGSNAGSGGEATGGSNAGSGGEATGGSGGSGGAPSGGSGGTGGTGATGGAAGGTGGTGGATTPSSLCDGTYHDWFRSGFEFPEGGDVGPAELPVSPWATLSGAATINASALASTGESVLVSRVGALLPNDGLRLRFSVLFGDEDNQITLGVNADRTGGPRLMVTLNAADGTFRVHDDAATFANATLGALEMDTEYFVELELGGSAGQAFLSLDNYATVPGSTLVSELAPSGVTAPIAGSYVAAVLTESGSASPLLEELRVARCDVAAGSYEDVFLDTFNRTASATVGSAEIPSTSTWDESQDPNNFSTTGTRLRMLEHNFTNITAPVARIIGNEAARFRFVTLFGATGDWPVAAWASPVDPGGGSPYLGVTLWNNGASGHIILRGHGGGGKEVALDQAFVPATPYYVEMAVDGTFGTATVRTASFTGPVVGVATDIDLGIAPATGFGQIRLTSAGGTNAISFDEIRLSQYVIN